MMPSQAPIGLLLAQTAKTVGRAFDDALTAAGGSLPEWLILLGLMRGGHDSQSDLAATVGVQGPTLTHHLNGLEKAGLVTRTRLPDNRRVHQVALTEAGRAKFHRLRQAAMAYDARLRQDFTQDELDMLRGLLGRLVANVPAVSEKDRGDG